MTVYLLHLNSPFKHARHYLGWTRHLQERLNYHALGRGSTFTKECIKAGINWQLARVWHRGTRKLERQLKNTHDVKPYCPVCMGDAVRVYKPRKVKHATFKS